MRLAQGLAEARERVDRNRFKVLDFRAFSAHTPVNTLLISCNKMTKWIRFDLNMAKQRGVNSL